MDLVIISRQDLVWENSDKSQTVICNFCNFNECFKVRLMTPGIEIVIENFELCLQFFVLEFLSF